MTPTIMWAILLLAGAVGLIFLEMFIPSGGILGFGAALCAVGAVILVYWQEGLLRGSLFLVLTSAVVPAAIAMALKYWPHTTIGRKISNMPPGEEASIASAPDYDHLRQFIGQRGLAKTKMLPSGTISIGGRTLDAVSQSGPIQSGQPIKIISVDGTRILVREAYDHEVVTNGPAAEIEDPFEA